MRQQVNLLDDDLKPPREILALGQVFAGWCALLGLLLLVSAWQVFDTWRLGSSQIETQARWQALQDANAALRDDMDRGPEVELVNDVERLRGLLRDQARMVNVVQSYERAGDQGFSSYLKELAAQHMEGLALSRIELRDGGTYILLSGETRQPVNVPRFLRRLSAGERFRGHRFHELRLEAQDSGLLRFDIIGPALERKG